MVTRFPWRKETTITWWTPSRYNSSLSLKYRPQINTDAELRALVDYSKHYSQDIPHTFWVEKQNHGCFYNSKAADPSKPFERNNEFLKNFNEYTHKKL